MSSLGESEIGKKLKSGFSGHYDSRATDANDYTSDAPGADDE